MLHLHLEDQENHAEEVVVGRVSNMEEMVEIIEYIVTPILHSHRPRNQRQTIIWESTSFSFKWGTNNREAKWDEPHACTCKQT